MAQTNPQVLTSEVSDYVHPILSESINYDDNLLRLPDDQRGQFGGGSDTYKTSEGGVLFNAQEGRQVLTGYVKLSKVTFDRFSQLDYTGKDMLADLNWSIGNHLQGHIGYNYTVSISAFTDFHEDVLDLRTASSEYMDAVWRFHPSWEVIGKYSKARFSYDAPDASGSSRTEETFTTGFDYLLKSGTKVGLRLIRLKTTYPQDEDIGGVLIDNGFVETDAKVNIFWPIYGQTQLLFLGGWTRRKHDFFTVRDETGFDGRLIVNWMPRERLTITGMAWREFGIAEGALINGAVSTGESITAAWTLTSKTSLTGTLKHEKRDFSAFAAAGVAALDLPSSDFSDNSRTASIGFSYTPVSQITLSLSVFHEARTGSLAAETTSYRAKGISFSASGQF